ncbi:yuxL [Symbiodinium sp. CCMP2592]|nr:yuxL [Symbiodinium sp. CCMP2592]
MWDRLARDNLNRSDTQSHTLLHYPIESQPVPTFSNTGAAALSRDFEVGSCPDLLKFGAVSVGSCFLAWPGSSSHRQVTVPTLIIHGDQDEVSIAEQLSSLACAHAQPVRLRQISPVEQAVCAHKACSSERKLVRYPRAGHNDLRLLAKREYFQELKALCTRVVTGDSEALAEPSGQTWLGMISDFISNGSALKCLPGVRRCFVTDPEMTNSPR